MVLRKIHWLLLLAITGLSAILGTYAVLSPKGPGEPVVMPVEVGVLYRSPQLSAERLADEIRQRGIKTVVNLNPPEGTDEAVCREHGVAYVEIPVGDVYCVCGQPPGGQTEKPPGPYDLTGLWKLIDDPATHPVLIHCQGGVHRTGIIVALYRIRYQGWQPDDAIKEMDLYGFNSYKTRFDNVKAYLRTLTDDVRQAKANAGGTQQR